MKKTLGNSLGAIGSTTFQGKKKVSSIETLRGIYGDNYGDVSSIQMITKRILERFRIPGPDRYREMMEINKKKYLSGNFRGMDWRSVSVFTNLDHNNRLKHKDVVTDVEKKELMKENVHIRLIDAHIRKNREEILSWSKENHLNYDEESFKIGKFIYVYNRMKNDFENFEGLDWFDENLKIPEIPQKPEDRLLCSFLHGYGENIAKRIEGNNLFVALINPSPDNVYEIESIKKTKIKATMTKYQGEYVMFLNKSRSFSQLGFINNVDPALVQKIVPFIYSIDRFSEENYRLDRHKEAINFLFDNLGPYPPNLKNHLVGEYLETIKKIKQDMVNNFDPNIYRVIKEISQNGKFIDNYLNRQLSMKRGQTGGGEPFKRCQYKFNPYIKHILKKYHDSI